MDEEKWVIRRTSYLVLSLLNILPP